MRKVLTLFLALMLCLSLAAPALAADPASGECGDNLTWSLAADGTLTISGTGPMHDYKGSEYPHTPWDNQQLKIITIVLEKGVTTIGNYAFEYCPITSMTIPDSVTSIGEGAFQYCDSLVSVTIPDSVTTIGRSAFYFCSAMTSVTIPENVTTIGAYAFASCLNLTSVTIPSSVTTIGEFAFNYCNPLDIYYGGSESQWNAITFGGDLYYPNNPIEITIHYNSAAPAPSASESIPVFVNGAAVAWTDAEPFIDENDRTMVPLRAVADAMGLEVNWDENTREASFTGSGKTIIFPIDSSTARTSEGGTVTMDTAAVIVNERTYAPIRYLAEFFGYTVGWDETARTVSITA